MNHDFINQLNLQIDNLQLNEELSKFTSMGVGGLAKYFFQTNLIDQIRKAIYLCQKFNIEYFILGGGTNVIISDLGFDGIVIKPDFKEFSILDTNSINKLSLQKKIKSRHQSIINSPYSTDLPNSYDEKTKTIIVKVGSSWRHNSLFKKCLENNITGLEWFTGIPGTVGGAVYMNIHGGNYFYSDFLVEVEIISKEGNLKIYKNEDLGFDYDISRFHINKDIVISATLQLFKGDINKAKNVYENWGLKKTQTQPQNSAGCMFQNLSQADIEKFDLPTPSIGYIIDKILNLKGQQIGQVKISDKHAAFIENLGNAKASDIFILTKLVQEKFENKFGFKPKLEVKFIGNF